MTGLKQNFLVKVLILFLSLSINACDRQTEHTQTGGDVTILHVWAHTGQEAERRVLQAQVARFNYQSPATDLELVFIPERDYNAQVQAAALAGDLPDILEFDGPYLYNYIWQNQLRPLDELLPASLLNDLLPSIIDQGTHGGHLYGVGAFDSGLGLCVRKSELKKINARLPESAADAWSVAEFEDILKRLAQQDEDKAVLDLKLNYQGEWFTYGFSPVLQSAGADLIDRKDYQTSNNIINSPAAVAALRHMQNWITKGYVDPNLDDAAFISGRVAISWAGHWEYARYHETFEDDLLVVPLPDFGHGSRTGQGSWNWGITRNTQYPQAAAQFITFLLQTGEVLAISNANAAVPGTRSAVQLSPLYGEHGVLRLFADQLIQGVSVPRPKTPAYPVITTEFQNAFQQIRDGGDVKQALDVAARKIDQDIRDNQGYPFLAN
ncbi:ABC transporter substrate-binding protein [Kaarinaea lacus]